MIVVKLMGGLGNQMFQYAAGKALSIKHDVPLFIDESFLLEDPRGAYTKRRLELGQLEVTIKRGDVKLLQEFKKRTLFQKFFRLQNPNVFNEGGSYNPLFFSAGKTVYLNGYWQSELYFQSIREVLQKEFTPRYNFSPANKQYLDKVERCVSVAVHVRRGDYVRLKSAANFHGVTDMAYYRKAINYFENNHAGCRFFIFSDDLPWCRENFARFKNIIFVDTDQEFSSTDLFIMKKCRHNIICNSSYSWWSAWLNENPDKVVIAPKNWFSGPASDQEAIYCQSWLKI